MNIYIVKNLFQLFLREANIYVEDLFYNINSLIFTTIRNIVLLLLKLRRIYNRMKEISQSLFDIERLKCQVLNNYYMNILYSQSL